MIGKDKVHLIHKAQTRSRNIALLLLNLGARWGGWLAPWPGHITPRKETQNPLYKKLGGHWDWPGWGGKSLPPTGLRTWDYPACSESLYQLCYPSHNFTQMYGYVWYMCEGIGIVMYLWYDKFHTVCTFL